MKDIGRHQHLAFFTPFDQISSSNESLIILIGFHWLTGRSGYEPARVKTKNLWNSFFWNTVLGFVLLLSKHLFLSSAKFLPKSTTCYPILLVFIQRTIRILEPFLGINKLLRVLLNSWQPDNLFRPAAYHSCTSSS